MKCIFNLLSKFSIKNSTQITGCNIIIVCFKFLLLCDYTTHLNTLVLNLFQTSQNIYIINFENNYLNQY